jgi:streptomycin 6-kinase
MRVQMIAIPDDFARGIAGEAGDAGRAWLRRLPSVIDSLCLQWSLIIDGAPMHGYLGLIVPVRRGHELGVLKVSWIDESNAHEIDALAAWKGQGAVQLLEAAPALGAMLLERLGPRSLFDVEIGEALAIAGQVLRRLSVPAPPGLPLLTVHARRLVDTLPARWEHLGRPLPRAIVDQACARAAELGPLAGSLLVNSDLHYGNVLAGQREPWLIIDPKPIVGDPEFGLAPLLWTRLEDIEDAGDLNHHFPRLVEAAGLDLDRARAWTLVHCVDYWLWALGAGLTEDPARCARLAASLIAS